MKEKIKFEVCCGCVEDAVEAARGGADRVELNNALFLGGLTPSVGTLRAVKKHTKLPVLCMVRPREGGFCYTPYEYETACADMELLLKNGADGIVFGFLNADGTVDCARCADFLKRIRKMRPDAETVFHRAIDVVPDVFAALDTLCAFGVTRVLTSGQRPTAIEGAETIAAMLRHAAGRIEILPGGGLNRENLADFVRATGVRQVHASARAARTDTSVRGNPEIFFGGKLGGQFLPEDVYKVTDAALVAETVRALDEVIL